MTVYEGLTKLSAWFCPLLADHLCQTTLFFLVVLLLTVALRRGPARIRYALWVIAGAKAAVPSASLAYLAERGGLHLSYFSQAVIPPEHVVSHSVTVFSRVTEHAVQLSYPVGRLAQSSQVSPALYLALVSIWFLGFAGLLVRWWKRCEQLRVTIRAAEKLHSGREVETLKRVRSRLGLKRNIQLIVSTQVPEPGVCGIHNPIIVLPQDLTRHLTDGELEVVMTHELVHIKRWDNLVSYCQMMLCSFLWFYPFIWIIDRKLLVEREQACDEDVLRFSPFSGDYTSCLWKVFRFCLGQNLAGASSAAGFNLKRRIEKIMSGKVQIKLSGWHRTLLAGSAVVMVLVSVVTGLHSQGGEGRLSGYVDDPSVARIPGAEVTVSNLDRNIKETVFTNDPGEYEFPALPEGSYMVQVNKLGFKSFQRKDVLIRAGTREQLNVRLEVGEVDQKVEVVGKSLRTALSSPVDPTRRIRVGGNVQQANLIYQTKPTYPEQALQAGIEGAVLLEAVIAKSGSVENLRLMSRGAHPFLVKAAMEAVKQWRYRPTLLNGEPIEVVTTITVDFRLAGMP